MKDLKLWKNWTLSKGWVFRGPIKAGEGKPDVTIEQLGQQLNSSNTEGKKTDKHVDKTINLKDKYYTPWFEREGKDQVKDWGGIEDWRDKDRLPRTTTRKTREIQFRTVEYEEEGSRYNMKPIGKEDEMTGEVKDENKRLMENLKEGYVKEKERVEEKIGECCGGFGLIELSSRHWQMEFWRLLELSKAIDRAGEDLGLPMEVRIWPMVDGDVAAGMMLAHCCAAAEDRDEALYRAD
ncbi:hypothetical protein PPACK8108_LOCUS15559 [Phakopsora pachyrhizi]|uniref:Uncharacterized protein n=1 Tax=Phakopsora pachyrhizi TaxID=170000 RepID=A0AAV0B8R2_PHAPC|nr:hypothetical protein PPACK8108_LOCUS15559 [Phakopsora pachyrhizi]